MAKFCPQCGVSNEDDSARCESCGAVLDPPAGEGAAGTGGAAPAWSRAGRAARARVAGLDRRWLVGGAAALVLAAGGVAAWQAGLLDGLLGGVAASPGERVDLDLIPVRFGEQCGYINDEGRMVINPQFQAARFFNGDGVAPVQVGGRWGLIDREGEYVVNPQFEEIFEAGQRGDYVVRVSDRWGLIDRDGDYLINPQYDEMGPYDSDGRALVRSGDRYGFVNRDGEYVVPPQFEAIAPRVTPDGRIEYFPAGLAPVRVNDRWGFVDREGRVAINPQYPQVGHFDPGTGLAPVMVTRTVETEDTAAREAWEAQERQYEADAQRWGYTHTPSERPDFTTTTEESHWGFINREGQVVVQARFDSTRGFDESGLAPVLVGDNWGYIDGEGEFAINPQFADARAMRRNGSGWIAVVATRSNDDGWRYGAIDRAGDFLVTAQFGGLGDFFDGRAAASLDDDMYAFGPDAFSQGLLRNLRGAEGDSVGVIDARGRYVVNPGYRLLLQFAGSRDYLYVGGDEESPTIGLLGSDGRPTSTFNGDPCLG